MSLSKTLRTERAKIGNDAHLLLNKAGATGEDAVAVDAMLARIDVLNADITRAETVEQVQLVLAAERGVIAATGGPSVDKQETFIAGEHRRMVNYMTGRLTNEDRAILATRAALPQFQNAASIGTATGGGYLVAPEYQRELLAAQKAFGGMRGNCRQLSTDSGVSLPWPTTDDTGNVATIVAENTAGVAGADMVFGQKTLLAWTYRSGYLLLSLELLQDSAFDFNSMITSALATRFARGQNAHLTNGNGTTQPQGITTIAPTGKTGLTGQTTTVIYDDLIDLQHSVDPAYRPGSIYMMHDSTVKVIRKLKDASGRPLWMDYEQPMIGGPAGTISGYPVVVNQDMPVAAANAKSIAFGNFQNYVIRDVMNLQMFKLDQLFIANGQIGFVAFQRMDGRLVSAANPIQLYAHSAT